jgi:hypothetical protein
MDMTIKNVPTGDSPLRKRARKKTARKVARNGDLPWESTTVKKYTTIHGYIESLAMVVEHKAAARHMSGAGSEGDKLADVALAVRKLHILLDKAEAIYEENQR